MLHDLQIANLSDESRKHARSLAWRAFTRLVLATAGAIGAKLGEAAASKLLGEDKEEDEEPAE